MFGIFKNKLKERVKELEKQLNKGNYNYDQHCYDWSYAMVKKEVYDLVGINIENRLKKLECEHLDTKILPSDGSLYCNLMPHTSNREICKDCNKIIKTFTDLEYKKEQVKRKEGCLKTLKAEIKELTNKQTKNK